MLLLAPAFYLDGYAVKEPSTHCENVSLIHGWWDDVVPFENSIRFAKQHKAQLKLVNDGHRLSEVFDVLNSELGNILSFVFD